MFETVLDLLRASGVYAWEASDVKERGWEFYFIRHALDQNRVREIETITLKVYQLSDGGESMGSASAELSPTADVSEAKALIESLAYRASLVKDKPYTLHAPRAAEPMDAQPSLDVAAIAGDFLKAVRALPETATEDINSYELFVSAKTRRLVTSTGIDVEESFPDSMLEVVVNARRDGHEIELYRNYTSGSCDAEGLARNLEKTMRYGKDRLRASATPNLGKTDVLFSSSAAVTLYRYFLGRLDTAMVARRLSDWELGKRVAERFDGDALTLEALRTLPNSSKNRRYDAEGAPIRDLVLLREGVVEHYAGGRKFSAYLGMDDCFLPTNLAVSGGTHSEEELRRGQYLEAVEFSDFQADPMTGDIFGEIRLGYWHDGETVTPVSGGSVSGSMRDFVGALYASTDTATYDNWRIPALTKLKGVTVSGG